MVATPYWDNGMTRLYHADARSLPLPDNSVDCVVTSPPYWGLRDYGLEEQGIGLEPTPEAYCANMVAVFREVWRVLKPSGTVWLNLGDSYNEKALVGIPWRVAFALQADGWYLRSDIIWSKPNPMPESVTDRPTKAHEYVFLLTKQAKYYYDADAIREAHTDESVARYLRGSSYTGDKPYSMKGKPRGHGMPSQKWETEGFTSSRQWVKGHSGYVSADGHVMVNENGRNKRSVWEIATQPYPEAHFATYPEKLVEPCILAGSSEKGVCAQCGKPWERIVEHAIVYDHVTTQRGKFKDGPYASQTGNGIGTHDIRHGVYSQRTYKGWQPTCDCNADVVPATVLDPFAGSGTTLAVAQRLGRRSVGADLSAEYLALAKTRLEAVSFPLPI